MERVVAAGMERAACKRPRADLDAAAWSRTCRVARAAAGGKDRHSKVVTARGLRDRRVRLPVPTAIRFYDVQDRLGVDQPSKAVAWLIGAAAAVIDALPSLDRSSFALPPAVADADDAGAEVSASETSKGSVLSLVNAPAEIAVPAAAHQTNHAVHAYSGNAGGGGAFAQPLHCAATDDDKSMRQKGPPTLAYYAAQTPSPYITPARDLGTMPQLAFLHEEQQQQPAVVFGRGTLQSNAVAAPLWPPAQQHPCLLQRFTSADAAGLPFFLGGGAAPVTSSADRRVQFWNFKQERKA